MKHLLLLPLLSMAALFVTSCANNGSGSGLGDNTGPFDADGTYRDDWADDPTKWRRKPSTPLASNDLPPADASPIDRASTPPRPATKSSSSSNSSSSSSSSSTARTQSAPKPKPTVAYKPKAKPKPKSTRYTVKQGDSLYVIAQRNKTTVSALQKANNISGSLIRPGQALVIPRR